MCEFCVEHGEGKKWYLQAKNYTEELYHNSVKQIVALHESFEEDQVKSFGMMGMLLDADPTKSFFHDMEELGRRTAWGQVVPLEDVDQIFDLSVSIIRTPCECRRLTTGKDNARFHYGVVGFKTDQKNLWESAYPEFSVDPGLSSGLEELTGEEAKRELRKLEEMGCIHSVWTFHPPLVTSICNCSRQDCVGLGTRMRLGLNIYGKGEYVGSIDIEKCSGCRECMKQCNFGAITYSPALERCYINQFQCFGCGICRAVCPNGAISLSDRNAVPELAKEW
jgi:ferredoxin